VKLRLQIRVMVKRVRPSSPIVFVPGLGGGVRIPESVLVRGDDAIGIRAAVGSRQQIIRQAKQGKIRRNLLKIDTGRGKRAKNLGKGELPLLN